MPKVIAGLPSQDTTIYTQSNPSASGTRTLEATYTRPYQAHGSIGPSCAVAHQVNDAMTVCNYSGDMWDAMSGKKVTTRSTITWMDDNSFKNEMYGPGPDGKEAKMMEIVATRK